MLFVFAAKYGLAVMFFFLADAEDHENCATDSCKKPYSEAVIVILAIYVITALIMETAAVFVMQRQMKQPVVN